MLWLLLDFFLHSFAILAITELLCRMAGSLMPAARYRLGLTGLMLLLLSPLLAILVPDFGLSIFLREPWSSSISFETRVLQQGFTGSGFTASLWPAWLWLAGVVLSLAPLTAGYARICWIAKRATSVSHPECTRSLDDLKARLRLRASPQLLKTDQVVVPIVFGCWRKRVILPADCEEWPVLTKRSVLAHELAHLKRRDLEAQMFASVVASLWWFQPLLALTRKRMAQDSELACDLLVLQCGVRASDYASDLVRIAQGFQGSQLASPAVTGTGAIGTAAIGMLRSGNLETRIRALLKFPSPQSSRRIPLLCATLLTMLTLAASTVSVNHQYNTRSIGATMMKRILPGTLFAAVGLSAGAVSGTLNAQSGSSEATLVAAKSDNRKPVHIEGKVQQTKLVKQVPPVYPVEAKKAGVQGTVVLEMLVSEQGIPEDIKVRTSPSEDLAQSATDAVGQWRYSPTLLNGNPIAVETEVTVTYRLAR